MWNPNIYDLVAYNSCAGTIVSRYKKGSTRLIRISNIYAPYTRPRNFWDKVTKSRVFKLSSNIICSDLNFTLGPTEIWGDKLQV